MYPSISLLFACSEYVAAPPPLRARDNQSLTATATSSEPIAEPPVDPCASSEVTPCIDVARSQPLWTIDPDGFSDWLILPDLNGDGYQELSWSATGSDGRYRSFITYGPLNRPMSLPGDADLTVLDHAIRSAWDGTGDGILDLLVVAYGVWYVLPGPFGQGEIDPRVSALGPWEGDSYDITGDGAPERLALDLETYENHVWSGPPSTWSDSPPLRLHHTCASDGAAASLDFGPSHDMDGDGVAEICVMHMSCTAESGPWLIPANSTGLVELTASGITHPCYAPMDDQTGDGIVDYLINDMLYAGPLLFDGWYLASEPVLVPHPSVLAADPSSFWTPSLDPLYLDLLRDGDSDIVRRSRESGYGGETLDIYEGGLDGGLLTNTPLLRLITTGNESRFLDEDGRYFILDQSDGIIRIIELISDSNP